MIAKTFLEFFLYGIDKFKEEMTLFPDERLWDVKGDIKNSAGNLALHITGNLKHFIGAVLGGTGYVRQRDSEFSDRDVPKAQLLQGLDEAAAILNTVLSSLPDEQLLLTYPAETFGKDSSTLRVLVILTTHLEYHLGQVNYLRRAG